MKQIAAVIILSVCSLAGYGQSASSVLKQAEKALGGTSLRRIESIKKSGTITRVSDGARGKYLFQSSKPNLLNISFDLGGFEIESGYNGRSGWRRDSRDGNQTLIGRASNAMQAKATYRNWLWLNSKNEKAKITLLETANIDGRPANVLLYTTPKGVSIKIYVDAQNGLVLRDEMPSGDGVERCDYSDYRDIDGAKMAFQNRVTIGSDTYEITLDDIKLNTQIARSEFDYPVDTKAPLPDTTALLKDLQANEDRLDSILDNYSYTPNSVSREIDKSGHLQDTESETV
ncbi:MAG TPA: hypothetical protein VGI80_04370, partial [Pyrinomonadaceae bacterium]